MNLHHYAIVKWRPRTSTFGKPIHSLELVEEGFTKEEIMQLQEKLKNTEDVQMKEKYEHAFVISMVKLHDFELSLTE